MSSHPLSWISQLARPEIESLLAYESAEWEPGLERLHANELPWRSLADLSIAGLNRYPQAQPRVLVERLAALYEVSPDCILLGRGSDEPIDLLARTFCTAGRDSVLVCPPTFGMFALAAQIQGAGLVRVPLAGPGFALDEQAVLDRALDRAQAAVKLLFVCSPNNPTGNRLDEEAIVRIADELERRALVVVDEAYVEFSAARSLARHVESRPNLAVLRTLSKAYALAGLRCGALIADPQVIALLRKVIAPYAISQPTVEVALDALEPAMLAVAQARLQTIAAQRAFLERSLPQLSNVASIWPSAANFILARFHDPARALERARAARLLIRDVRKHAGLEDCLRITVGTEEQNRRLLEALA